MMNHLSSILRADIDGKAKEIAAASVRALFALLLVSCGVFVFVVLAAHGFSLACELVSFCFFFGRTFLVLVASQAIAATGRNIARVGCKCSNAIFELTSQRMIDDPMDWESTN